MARLGNGVKNGVTGTFRFIRDSVNELKRVRWPNRKELTSYTIVVLVTVIIVAIYFTLLDLGISNLVQLIVG
nr:preprotein translocase subunit SecE [Novibacillus thermophilus]